jgi:hypothetical protein
VRVTSIGEFVTWSKGEEGRKRKERKGGESFLLSVSGGRHERATNLYTQLFLEENKLGRKHFSKACRACISRKRR